MIQYILLALLLGGVAGYLNSNWATLIENKWISDHVFNGSLLVLLFVMGAAFSMDREAVARMRRVGVRILVMPFAVASGSIVGGLVGGLVLGISVGGAMAVSAGFGWYTLAGPLLGQLLGAQWGALGFVANFMRELLTIFTAPWTCRLGKRVSVAFGGATSMDTTLGVIVRYCGAEALITSFSSGFILSVLAPFAVMVFALLA